MPFEVGARLSVQGNRVLANDFAASVSRLRLPSFVVDELTRGVNPLYDFDPQGRWPLAINLSTAQASDNALTMRGGIQWLGLGNRRDRNRSYPQNERDRSRDQDDSNAYPDEDDNNAPRNNRNNRPADILGDIFGH